MDTTARVRHVALTRIESRTAEWIAKEAEVSRDTAVTYLERMVEEDDLEVIETDEERSYKSDNVTQFLHEVRALAEVHTLDELSQELNAIGEEIDTWKDTYEVESLTELRQSVGRDDLDSEGRHERLETIDEWVYNIEMREAIQFAISLKNSLTTLGVESPPEESSTNHPHRG
ncbi:DUF7342 family protein [Halorussus salinus]|uniref:DUF7342 family protein n=1 Tax=Halorussus salinus TaxID=1364935 RepID=UPI0010927F80|nr:hypothetical protein [Halorussus salinus]